MRSGRATGPWLPATALLVGGLVALVAVSAPVEAGLGAAVVATGLAMLARPDRGTLVALGLVYSNACVVLVNNHGLPRPIAAAPFVLLLLPVLHHLVVLREPLVWLPATSWSVAFLGVYLTSALTSPTMWDTGSYVLIYITEGFGCFLLLTNIVRTPDQARRCIQTIVLTGAALGSISLLQHLRGMMWTSFGGFGSVGDRYVPGDTEWTNSADGTRSDGHARLAGPIGEANFFALILLVLLPWGVYLTSTATGVVRRTAWATGTVLVGAGVVLTYSRGAIVAIVVTTVLLSILRIVPRKSLAVLALGGVLSLTFVPSYGERLAEVKKVIHFGRDSQGPPQADAAARGRLSEVLAAFAVYRDHPVLGVGPGQFPRYYQQYSGDASGGVHSGQGGRQAHNLVAGLAAETGTFGLLTFFGGLVASVRRLWWMRSRPETALVAAAALTSLCLAFTASMFLHLAYMRYLWLHLALAAVVAAVSERPARHPVEVARDVIA